MKCEFCGREFEDESLLFCPFDGKALRNGTSVLPDFPVIGGDSYPRKIIFKRISQDRYNPIPWMIIVNGQREWWPLEAGEETEWSGAKGKKTIEIRPYGLRLLRGLKIRLVVEEIATIVLGISKGIFFDRICVLEAKGVPFTKIFK